MEACLKRTKTLFESSPYSGRTVLSIGVTRKSQKLFPFVTDGKKHEGVSSHLKNIIFCCQRITYCTTVLCLSIGTSLKIVKIIILADPKNWTILRKRKNIRNFSDPKNWDSVFGAPK